MTQSYISIEWIVWKRVKLLQLYINSVNKFLAFYSFKSLELPLQVAYTGSSMLKT